MEKEIKLQTIFQLGLIQFFLIPNNQYSFCSICGNLTHFVLKNEEDNTSLPCCHDQICYDLVINILKSKDTLTGFSYLSNRTQIVFEPDLDEDDPEFFIAFEEDFSN